MPKAKDVIGHFRGQIVANAVFIAAGIGKERIYRQFLQGVKDPVYPAICIVTDSDPYLFAPIEQVNVWMSAYAKTQMEVEPLIEELQSMFHRYKGKDSNVTVFLSESKGNYNVPIYDDKLNAWGATILFKTRIG